VRISSLRRVRARTLAQLTPAARRVLLIVHCDSAYGAVALQPGVMQLCRARSTQLLARSRIAGRLPKWRTHGGLLGKVLGDASLSLKNGSTMRFHRVQGAEIAPGGRRFEPG
jgi:hypothetical protein